MVDDGELMPVHGLMVLMADDGRQCWMIVTSDGEGW